MDILQNISAMRVSWFLCSTIALVAHAKACCLPKSWSGPVRVISSTVAPGLPNTEVNIYYQVYDAKRQRVGMRDPDFSSSYVKLIFDYSRGVQQTISVDMVTGDNKCFEFPFKAKWREACMPANASESEGFYLGQASGVDKYEPELDAKAFSFSRGTVNARLMVSEAKCNMIGEVIWDTGDTAGAKVINRLYVNQTTWENTDFFDLPKNTTCLQMPTPYEPTPWQVANVFGFLMSLAE